MDGLYDAEPRGGQEVTTKYVYLFVAHSKGVNLPYAFMSIKEANKAKRVLSKCGDSCGKVKRTMVEVVEK